MNEEKAVKMFEDLVIVVMQQGGFKDFNTLDEYRNAAAFLKAKYITKQLPAGNGQLKTEKAKT